MLRRTAVFTAACLCVSTSAHTQETPRIVSTSLCGDAYLLSVAPGGAAALSWQSRDKLSRASEQLKALPQAWDDPERLLSLRPDLVVFGPGEGAKSAKFLSAAGIETITLNWGEDFETVSDNILRLGEATGQPDRARRLARDLEERLSAVHSGSSPNILYLSRAGGSAGPGTLVDAAITAAGGRNVMTAPGWTTPDPEYLIALKPDLIITSYFTDGYESANAPSLRHKTVKRFIESHDRLDIPGSLWPCAGPGLIEAAELINAAITESTLP